MIFRSLIIFFVVLVVDQPFSRATIVPGEPTPELHREIEYRPCAAVETPDWTIGNLRNVTLDAWPWNCLESRHNSDVLSKLVSKSSPNICDAAEKGFIGFVQYYIEKKGALLVRCSPDDNTPLHLASANGHLHVVEYIANKAGPSANLNKFNARQFFPITEAAYNGHLTIVKYLLDEKLVFRSIHVSFQVRLLQAAAASGNFDLVKYLIEEKNYPILEADKDPEIFLWAGTGGNVDLIKYLVNLTKINTTQIQDDTGNNPLHKAALAGKLEATRYFVETFGFKVDEDNDAWESPSYLAVVGGSIPVLKYLIDEKGAELNARTVAGHGLLHAACRHGHLEIVKYLLDKKVNLNKKDDDGMTPIQNAAEQGKLNVVRYLIGEKKVDARSNERGGRSLLHYAASSGDVDTIKYLLDEANMLSLINSKDEMEQTPAMKAANAGKLAALKYLLDVRHADATIISLTYGNLLMITAGANQLEIVKYLVEEKGFDVNARTPDSFSVYQYALMSDQSETENSVLLDYLEAKIQKRQSPKKSV